MNFFKRKVRKFGRRISSSQERKVSFDFESSAMAIYLPLSAPRNMKRHAVVVKHHDRQSKALNNVVLEIMGTDPSLTTGYGKPIQTDLASRFEYLATRGLLSEQRKELLQNHLSPVNCKLIDPPNLNPELKAAVTDNIIKRDKAIYNKQKQRSCAIACLVEALTVLLEKDEKDPNVLRLLTDAGRILCDSQHADSITRRNFILSAVNKELKDQIYNSKVDTMLFGTELPRISIINKQKPGCSNNLQTKRSNSPVDIVVPIQSPRLSKQSRINCWQENRSIKKVQGNESEERVRVRRARASDVPRVLRFVREHARAAWPGLAAPPSGSHLILCDYVARALAQGHSMLAEQQEARRGWGSVRGLALGTAICPWDAAMLERWARCMRCTKSRRLMHFTAHCLRAPALHDKYHVQKILQITLMVPIDAPKRTEIIHVLAQNAIQRGRDVGFKVVRFDTCDATIAQSLEDLELKKEWVLTYDVYPDAIKETADKTPRIESSDATSVERSDERKKGLSSHFLAVYTSHAEDPKPTET